MNTANIYDHVERLGELLRIDARQAGATAGLQPVQLEVLHYLSICNRYSDTPMAVTDYLGQTKGTVSQTLKVLENKGLLLRKADADDKRITHLRVSARGRRLLDRTIPTPMFVKACEAMSQGQQDDIATALRQLLTSVLHENGMKTFGVCHTCRYNSRSGDGDYFCNLVQQPLAGNEVELICREHECKAS